IWRRCRRSRTRRRRHSSWPSCASTAGTCRRRPRRSIRPDRICIRKSSSTTSSGRVVRVSRKPPNSSSLSVLRSSGGSDNEERTTNNSIGIFDSGVGGLTVFREIARLLPGHPLIYLGDSARVPYGTKSPEIVQRYSLQAARHLVQRGIGMLVVACNTATSAALPALKEALEIPVLGVIEPGARAAAEKTRGRIGVIATEGTVNSRAYTRAIHDIK